ncbi:MAG: hypothetical protein GY832_22140 [Chloroflexi bacterium]|nr:hypothetical protein [Chloroflexota bacterium]
MDKELKQAFEVIEKRTAKCTEGDRHIVVLDRGWIFVGNLSLTEDVYTLTNAVNIRKWEKGGFGALSKSREAAGATLDSCEPIRFAKGAPLFVVPIQEDWHE